MTTHRLALIISSAAAAAAKSANFATRGRRRGAINSVGAAVGAAVGAVAAAAGAEAVRTCRSTQTAGFSARTALSKVVPCRVLAACRALQMRSSGTSGLRPSKAKAMPAKAKEKAAAKARAAGNLGVGGWEQSSRTAFCEAVLCF